MNDNMIVSTNDSMKDNMNDTTHDDMSDNMNDYINDYMNDIMNAANMNDLNSFGDNVYLMVLGRMCIW